MKDEKYLVCQFADALVKVAGTAFDYACKWCGRRVMMAPSGQALYARGGVTVLCIACAEVIMMTPGADIKLAGSPATVEKEMKTEQPNLRRNRN